MTATQGKVMVVLGGLLATAAIGAKAITITWANNAASTDWGATASWTGGQVPGADDTASVPKGGVRPSVASGETHPVGKVILYCKDSNGCSLNGTGTLELGSDGLTITVESGSGGTSGTLKPAFAFTANQTWSVGGAGNAVFTFDGLLSDVGTARSLTLGGAGVAVLNGQNTFAGGFARTAGWLRLGAGSTLGPDGSVVGGPAGTGPLSLSGTIVSDTANRTFHNPLILAGNVTFGRNGQSTYTIAFAPSTATTPTTATLHATTTGTQHVVTLFNNRQNPTISQAIGESGATGIGLVITNGTGTGSTTTGQLTLSGATPNTFGGTVTVGGAVLRLAKSANVAAIAGDVDLTGGKLVVAAAEQIADTARFSVSTAASPVLEFTGVHTESVSQLWVDGTRMLAGTYGRVGNSAGAVEAAWISGDGLLRVLPEAGTVVTIR